MTAGVQARVLIVAKDDAVAGPLAEGLDRLGWRTVTARGPYAATATLVDLNVEAAIVDLASGGGVPPAAGTDPAGEPFHAIAAKVADWLQARKGK